MVKIKLNDKKRKTIKEINQTNSPDLPYEVSKFIADELNISFEEVLKSYKEGRLLVSKSKKLFSSFLFEEWSEALGVKPEAKDVLTETLWYDFFFMNNNIEGVLRYSTSNVGINDDTLLHIFYGGVGEENKE